MGIPFSCLAFRGRVAAADERFLRVIIMSAAAAKWVASPRRCWWALKHTEHPGSRDQSWIATGMLTRRSSARRRGSWRPRANP